jgi:hypothetical protein
MGSILEPVRNAPVVADVDARCAQRLPPLCEQPDHETETSRELGNTPDRSLDESQERSHPMEEEMNVSEHRRRKSASSPPGMGRITQTGAGIRGEGLDGLLSLRRQATIAHKSVTGRG